MAQHTIAMEPCGVIGAEKMTSGEKTTDEKFNGNYNEVKPGLYHWIKTWCVER